MHRKPIAQGAEAKLFLENNQILKNRFPKAYRIKEIDEKLRGFRTRREAKILQKLQAMDFPAPKVIKNDEKENLVIEKIDGKLVKDVLEKLDYRKLCSGIGKKVAILHNNSIIHGDLTTSNMILSNASELRSVKCESSGRCEGLLSLAHSLARSSTRTRSQLTEIYFIDFGLSFFSEKAEDKAVDLHLLKEGFESKHYKIWEECFKCALDAYRKEAKKSQKTLKRLEIVEKRGRYMRASLRARSQTTIVQRKEVKAVLFDLDGVLVDSLDAWYYTYDDIIRHFKVKPIPKKEFKNIFGNTIEANVRRIVKITTKEANKLAVKYFNKNKAYVKFFPETKSVLKKLSNSKVKIALITNTPNKILILVLKHHKIKKYFNAIVTIDDVKKGKPAPDMVLKACKLLRVKPENTILVGDTKNDMLAGKRAGCITVGYKTDGDYRINNLQQIEKFIYV